MILFSFLILNSYIIVLFVLYKGFQRVLLPRSSEILTIEDATILFTIIIPFRNEATHLPKLITSLNGLKYNKNNFEILFVDDASTDASASIIVRLIDSALSYQILKNVVQTNSPKKDAITLAVAKAKGSWIITTDADCVVPPAWLLRYDDAIGTFDAKMLCAPVAITAAKGIIRQFQQADLLSLQGITIGSFGVGNSLMCNGANLAFEKTAFFAVNGYEGNTHLASGDDVFMLQKMKAAYSNQVHFIKSQSAMVTTQALCSWSAVINQRVRWASKTASVKNQSAILLGLLAFVVNALCILYVILGMLQITPLYVAFIFIVLKLLTDTLFISKIKKWFSVKVPLHALVISGCIYPIVTCIVVLKSVFKKYHWKGRSY